jgi:hypothetical protein
VMGGAYVRTRNHLEFKDNACAVMSERHERQVDEFRRLITWHSGQANFPCRRLVRTGIHSLALHPHL